LSHAADSCIVTIREFPALSVFSTSSPPLPESSEWTPPCTLAARSLCRDLLDARAIRATSPVRLSTASVSLLPAHAGKSVHEKLGWSILCGGGKVYITGPLKDQDRNPA
jgi:hypothetical protein